MPDSPFLPANVHDRFTNQIPDFELERGKSDAERIAESNHASEFHKRLSKWIQKFDAQLDNEQEVGVRLVSFGQTVVFHPTTMGYWNPSLIIFKGITEDGNPVELIQHVSQISILLMTLKRKDRFHCEVWEEAGGAAMKSLIVESS